MASSIPDSPVPVRKDVVLHVKGTRVNVRVVPGNDDRVEMTVSKGQQEQFRDVKVIYDEDANALTITELQASPTDEQARRLADGSIFDLLEKNRQGTGSAHDFTTDDENPDKPRATLTVRVPPGSTTIVDETFGNIQVNDVNGFLRAAPIAGLVSAWNVTSAVLDPKGASTMYVNGVTGTLDVNASKKFSGSVEVERADVARSSIRSRGRGNVKVEGHARHSSISHSGPGRVKLDVNAETLVGSTEGPGKVIVKGGLGPLIDDRSIVRLSNEARCEIRSSRDYLPPTGDVSNATSAPEQVVSYFKDRGAYGDLPTEKLLEKLVIDRLGYTPTQIARFRSYSSGMSDMAEELLASSSQRVVSGIIERASAEVRIHDENVGPNTEELLRKRVGSLTTGIDDELVLRGIGAIFGDQKSVDPTFLSEVIGLDSFQPVDLRLLRKIGLDWSLAEELGDDKTFHPYNNSFVASERRHLADPAVQGAVRGLIAEVEEDGRIGLIEGPINAGATSSARAGQYDIATQGSRKTYPGATPVVESARSLRDFPADGGVIGKSSSLLTTLPEDGDMRLTLLGDMRLTQPPPPPPPGDNLRFDSLDVDVQTDFPGPETGTPQQQDLGGGFSPF